MQTGHSVACAEKMRLSRLRGEEEYTNVNVSNKFEKDFSNAFARTPPVQAVVGRIVERNDSHLDAAAQRLLVKQPRPTRMGTQCGDIQGLQWYTVLVAPLFDCHGRNECPFDFHS